MRVVGCRLKVPDIDEVLDHSAVFLGDKIFVGGSLQVYFSAMWAGPLVSADPPGKAAAHLNGLMATPKTLARDRGATRSLGHPLATRPQSCPADLLLIGHGYLPVRPPLLLADQTGDTRKTTQSGPTVPFQDHHMVSRSDNVQVQLGLRLDL